MIFIYVCRSMQEIRFSTSCTMDTKVRTATEEVQYMNNSLHFDAYSCTQSKMAASSPSMFELQGLCS